MSTTQGHVRTGSRPVNHTGSLQDRITSCQPHRVTPGQDHVLSTTQGHLRTGSCPVNHTGSPQDRITSCQPHRVTSGQDHVLSAAQGHHLRTGSEGENGYDNYELTVMIIMSYDKNDHTPTDKDSLWPHADSKFRSCKTGWRLTHRETREL